MPLKYVLFFCIICLYQTIEEEKIKWPKKEKKKEGELLKNCTDYSCSYRCYWCDWKHCRRE